MGQWALFTLSGLLFGPIKTIKSVKGIAGELQQRCNVRRYYVQIREPPLQVDSLPLSSLEQTQQNWTSGNLEIWKPGNTAIWGPTNPKNKTLKI